MKNYFNTIVLVVLATFAVGLTSCGGDESEDPQPVETLEDFLVGSWTTVSVEYEDISYADACGDNTLTQELEFDGKGNTLRSVNLTLDQSKSTRSSTIQDGCTLTVVNTARWSLTSSDVLVISSVVEIARLKILSVNTGAGTAKAQLVAGQGNNSKAIGIVYNLRKQ